MQLAAIASIISTNAMYVISTPLLPNSFPPNPLAARALFYYLLQHAAYDEWNRVLYVENRTGLALLIAACHFCFNAKFTVKSLIVAVESGDKVLKTFKILLLPGLVWSGMGVLMNWQIFIAKRREKLAAEQRKKKLISWGWPRSWCHEESWF
jgi:tryptophan-rich sensory protein